MGFLEEDDIIDVATDEVELAGAPEEQKEIAISKPIESEFQEDYVPPTPTGLPEPALGGTFIEAQDLYPTDDKQVPEWAIKYPTMYGLYGAGVETTSSLKKAIGATPSSAVQYGKNIAQAVMHPLETGKGLVNLGVGVVEKAIPGRQEHEIYADQVGEFLVDRYGSFDKFRKTVETDPVGVLADVSTLFTVAGGLVSKAGKLTSAIPKDPEMARLLGRVGLVPDELTAAIKSVGQKVEPLALPLKGAKAVGKQAAKTAGHVFGITTGADYGAVKTAFNIARERGQGHPLYKDAMRGKITQPSILSAARDSLYDLKAFRSHRYTEKFAKIKNLPDELDMTPIHSKLEQLMSKDEFNIGRTSRGKLDFSRSTIDQKSQPRIRAMIEEVEGWGARPGDKTPQMLDTLKRSLDDLYVDSGNGRVMSNGIKAEVKKLLNDNVPEYSKMTAEYEQLSEIIADVNDALSIGGKSKDVAIKKLTTALRDSNEYRSTMMDKLDVMSNGQLKAKIAGMAFRSPLPEGAVGRVIGMLEIMTVFRSGIDPSFFGVLAGSSPRLVGELLNGLGTAVHFAEKGLRQLPRGGPTRQTAFQAGRAENEIQERLANEGQGGVIQ